MGWFDNQVADPKVAAALAAAQQAPANSGAVNTGVRGGVTPPIQNAQGQTVAGATAPASMSREQYRDAWMGSNAGSMADLQSFLAKNGGELLDGAGRVRTPNGEVIDMGIAARGSAAGTHQFKPGWGATGADIAAVDQAARANGGGQGGNLYGGGGMSLGEGMQGGGGFSSTSMSMNRPQWTGGDFSYDGARPVAERIAAPEAFKGVSAADMAADPGYQFRLQEGQRAIENSRLAGGLGRTGDTAKELLNYGQQAASQEYGNVYGRKFGEHQSSLGAQMQTGMFNSEQGLRAQGQDFGQKHGAWQGNVNASLGLGNLSLGHKSADNAYALGQGQLSLGQGQLGLQQADQSFQQNTMFPWQQQYQMAGMGLQAAGMAGGYGANYGANQGNTYMSQGNANAAGQVGAGNAYANAYSGMANQAQDMWSQWYAGGKPKPTSYPGVPVTISKPTGGG